MANQKLSATISIGATVGNTVKKIVGVSKALEGVDREISDIVKRQKELDGQRKVLEKQGKSVDHLKAEYEDLGRSLETLRVRQGRLTSVHQGAQRAAGALGGAMGTLARQSRTLAYGLVGIVAGNGVLGVSLIALTKGVADVGDEVGETAAKIGIGTTALQELRYAAKMSGVETEAFDASLFSMTKNVGLSARGMGKATKAFSALGIDAKKLIKLAPDQQLEAIAEALSRVPNQTQRATLAMQIFGDAGKDMVLMAADGADGIEKLRSQAARLGIVLDKDAIEAAGKFNDSLDRSKFALQGLKNTIGSELMPVVTNAMDSFTGWVVDNREPIREFARNFAGGLQKAGPIVGQIATGLGTVIGKAVELLKWSADMVGGWENLGIVAGTLFMAPTILAVTKVGWEVGALAVKILALRGKWFAAATAAEAASTRMVKASASARIGTAGTFGRAGLGVGLGVMAAGAYSDAVAAIPTDPKERAEYYRKKQEGMESTLRGVPVLGGLMRGQEWLQDRFQGDAAPRGANGERTGQRPALTASQGISDPNPANRPGQRPAMGQAPQVEERKTEINLGGVNITATGMDPKQVVQEVMDKLRQLISGATSGALYSGEK